MVQRVWERRLGQQCCWYLPWVEVLADCFKVSHHPFLSEFTGKQARALLK